LWAYDEVDLITLVDEIQVQDKAARKESERVKRRR
jgi:hypothetical protein